MEKSAWGKSVRKYTASWSRWIHIYLSMISFISLLFFAVTGLTLNHTEWFEDSQVTSAAKGNMKAEWVSQGDSSNVAKLEIVEYLRNQHQISGAVGEFAIDESQCTISFNGPGYTADVFINREDGNYDISETKTGLWGIMNDLHKGRDAGKGWAWLIDISAVLMVIVSLSGLLMLFFLKKKRVAGTLMIVLGGIALWLVYWLLVP
ncbi:MAG: hypothetical protein RLZZ42_1168 [Bacteroidota bacterium]